MAQLFPPLDVAGQTDVGLKRTRNEDSFTVLIPSANSSMTGQDAMFIVCDGMGGMGGGDVASKTAIEEITKTFYDPSVTQDYDPLPRLRNALEAANVRVRETAQTVGLPRIGATGAGMILTSTGDAVVFNIGDSRVYRARGSYIELLTRDQSVMASQLEAGLVSQEEARLSRNVNVTAFIGQPMPISPVYSRMQTQAGDIFIICSDGVWDLVEPNELLKFVQAPAQEAARKLIALVRQRGAPDNATVIIVRVGTAARSIPLLPLAVAGLIVLAAVGGFALARSELFAASPPPAKTASVTMTTAPPSATVPAVIATLEATVEASPVIGISVNTITLEVTPDPTAAATEASAEAVVALPTATPTTEPTATQQATETPSATSTRAPSRTPAPSATNTVTPTRAPTQTPTLTPSAIPSETPTLTETAPPSATPPPTAIPSATTPPEPTVTVNPTLITFTPGPQPTSRATPAAGISAITHDAFMLVVAHSDGVILNSSATLTLYDEAATPEATVELLAYLATLDSVRDTATPEVPLESTAEITPAVDYGIRLPLDAGTQVRLLGDQATPDPSGGIQLLVEVVKGSQAGQRGWISLQALLQATPAMPYVQPASSVIRGVNIRSGEGLLSSVVDVLLPGQFAQLIAVSTSPLGWYYVEMPSGGRGWVSPENVEVEGSRDGIKRLTPPSTPTFTPSPTETPLPLPTLTSVGAG